MVSRYCKKLSEASTTDVWKGLPAFVAYANADPSKLGQVDREVRNLWSAGKPMDAVNRLQSSNLPDPLIIGLVRKQVGDQQGDAVRKEEFMTYIESAPGLGTKIREGVKKGVKT